MQPIKLLSLFAGIGAFEAALRNLGIPHQVVAFSEIDKYAIRNYCAIHHVDASLNIGDISTADLKPIPPFDIMTYGFPCQDLSIAGEMVGFDGSRSSLLRYAERIIELHHPAIAVAENVKNLVSRLFQKDFEALLDRLDKLGYVNYWQVLNAAEFGVPQNRERVFLISIRKDQVQTFRFPEPTMTPCSLFDVLEDEAAIPEKLYIDDDKARPLIERFLMEGAEGLYGVVLDHGELRATEPRSQCIDANYWKGFDNHGQRTGILTIGHIENPAERRMHNRVHLPEGHSPTILARHDKQPKIMVIGQLDDQHGVMRRRVHSPDGLSPTVRSHHSDSPKIMLAGMLDIPGELAYARRVYDPAGIAPTVTTQQSKMPKIKILGRADWVNGHELMKRIYSVEGVSPTLNTVSGGGREPKIQVYARIRRLSPRECWRLMGFTDHDFDIAKAQTSDSQLYKQAGNSIVVDVLMAIFARLFDQHPSVQSLKDKAGQYMQSTFLGRVE